MVDREARNQAADILRRFRDGEITNKEYEAAWDEGPDKSADPVLRALYRLVWFCYDDLRTHRMTGKWALRGEGLELWNRCLLFLGSDLEYQWPTRRETEAGAGCWALIVWPVGVLVLLFVPGFQLPAALAAGVIAVGFGLMFLVSKLAPRWAKQWDHLLVISLQVLFFLAFAGAWLWGGWNRPGRTIAVEVAAGSTVLEMWLVRGLVLLDRREAAERRQREEFGEDDFWPFRSSEDYETELARQGPIPPPPGPEQRVDGEARRRAAQAVADFRDLRIHNLCYLDRMQELESADPALAAVQDQISYFHETSRTHRLNGRLSLDGPARDLFTRGVVFLRSELPYTWPGGLGRVVAPVPRARLEWWGLIVGGMLLWLVAWGVHAAWWTAPKWCPFVALGLMLVWGGVILAGPWRRPRRAPASPPGLEWWPFRSQEEYETEAARQGEENGSVA